jgi:aspartyl-tRNA(Asn)/glutamyl-tRNA(Gln) amidotransferase subunit C
MAIDKSHAFYVARLASLSITETEAEKYSKQLSDILNYAEQLNGSNTDHIDPSFHASFKPGCLRPDEVVPFENGSGILKNAPEGENTFFTVPRILE